MTASAPALRSPGAPAQRAASVVVGVHDGHNASVAVLCDGKLTCALQEERFTRIKNQGDAPVQAIREARKILGDVWDPGALRKETPGGGTPDEEAALDLRVALNGRYMNYGQWRTDTILADYDRSSSILSRCKQTLKNGWLDRAYQSRKAAERAVRLSALGFVSQSSIAVDHHQAHAAAAYYTVPWGSEPTLVLTCDGSGDRLAATVSIGDRGQLTRIAEISEHDSIGRLYSAVTRHLGMNPLEHEYKVMGLAGYASDASRTESAASMFRALFEFPANAMVWRRRKGVPSMYAARDFLTRLLTGMRFDVIAAGLQRFLEGMLVEWARRAIQETGIRRIACSGGVFMNVKANLAVLELPEVEWMYVLPSCGDESNSIGAAYAIAAGGGAGSEAMGKPLGDPMGAIYFGRPITDEEAEQALDGPAKSGRLRHAYVPDIEARVAEQVADGNIVARAKGASEFGARALGNRSILARADSPDAVRTINRMIKCRDFWMPFAPSVLARRAEDYYIKPKPVNSAYMMFAFRSRPEKRAAFAAAQHPYDGTTRPHEVFEAHNPDYYRLLEEYEARTGEGIVLNTSFNLHGEPMVERAGDAVSVFLRSGLDRMALGNWWVEKS